MSSLKSQFTSTQGLEAFNEVDTTLKKNNSVLSVNIAGSLRRQSKIIGDVDVVVVVDDRENYKNVLTQLGKAFCIDNSSCNVKSTILVPVSSDTKVPVDVNLVLKEHEPYAMMHFTGSKEENVRLRRIAKSKNWMLSQYGLVDRDTKAQIISASLEQDVYSVLGTAYRYPHER